MPSSSLFRYPAFLFFWIARVFTASGYQMQSVIVAWQVYELTHDPYYLGLVGLMQFLPRVLLVFPAGTAADRYSRRLIMLTTQLIQTGSLLLLFVASASGWMTLPLLFALSIVTGAARTFEMPATQALLPALVPTEMLPRAVALSASAMQAATIVAPALGGVLYVLGATTVYGLTATLFAVAACLSFCIHAPHVPVSQTTESNWASVLSGLTFIRQHPLILGALSLDMMAVLMGGATALLPVVAAEILQTGPWGLGLLRSAPAVGALGMSLWLSQKPLKGQVGLKMFAAVAVFGLATLAFGLSQTLTSALLSLVVLGAADMVSVVIRSALIQLRTPDAMRGRVSAVNALFIGASNQLGEYESGLTAAWFGVVPAILLGGVGTLAIVVCWMRWFPALRQADQLAK